MSTVNMLSVRLVDSAWPKIALFFKNCPKSSHGSFYLIIEVFKIAQKVFHTFGLLCMEKCHQELSKIAQYGHTACSWCDQYLLLQDVQFFGCKIRRKFEVIVDRRSHQSKYQLSVDFLGMGCYYCLNTSSQLAFIICQRILCCDSA